MAFVLVGRELAHYNLTAPLGSGAMSEVYLARDARLERDVAVKVILDSVARKPGLVKRFEREARAAGRLDHPNVARVYYFGQTDDGAPFYAMELVDGWSLGDIVEARVRIRVDQVLSLLAQTCAGLQAALDAGIVHRDIKPANLMVAKDGLLKVVDFGLAKLSDDKSMTRSGTMLGTPYYMAPEIVRGEGGDWRADIYSLGVTFFHLLTGFPPFEADTPYGVMMKHINQPVPDLAKSSPRLPPGLCHLVTSMLHKDPESRPRSYKLLQSSAMRLATELTPKELMYRLAWCVHESRNTVDIGGRCSSCQRSYGGAERPARFHVDLVGWNRNGADEDVAAYIGRAVGNPPEVVAPLLQELPFRAAFKAPRERAKRMQRTFFEMGADVELVPAEEKAGGLGDRELTELPFRPYWPPEPEIEGAGANNALDTRKLLTRQGTVQGRRPSVVALAMGGLVLLVGVLLVALFLEKTGEPEALASETDTPATTPAETAEPVTQRAAAVEPSAESSWNGSFAEEPPTEVPTAEEPTAAEVAAGEGTPTPEEPSSPDAPPERLSSNRFDVSSQPGVDLTVARGALRTLEEQATEVDRLLDLRSAPLAVVFTNEPHVDDSGGRMWPSSPFMPALEFPLGGAAGARDGSFVPAARLLYGRAALHRASGASCPPHLLVGLSLVLEQDTLPPTAVADLMAQGEIRPREIGVSVTLNSPRTERLLHSYASWIVIENGWPKVDKMLDALGRSGNVEIAFIQAFGRSPGEIESEWLAAVTGVE